MIIDSNTTGIYIGDNLINNVNLGKERLAKVVIGETPLIHNEYDWVQPNWSNYNSRRIIGWSWGSYNWDGNVNAGIACSYVGDFFTSNRIGMRMDSAFTYRSAGFSLPWLPSHTLGVRAYENCLGFYNPYDLKVSKITMKARVDSWDSHICKMTLYGVKRNIVINSNEIQWTDAILSNSAVELTNYQIIESDMGSTINTIYELVIPENLQSYFAMYFIFIDSGTTDNAHVCSADGNGSIYIENCIVTAKCKYPQTNFDPLVLSDYQVTNNSSCNNFIFDTHDGKPVKAAFNGIISGNRGYVEFPDDTQRGFDMILQSPYKLDSLTVYNRYDSNNTYYGKTLKLYGQSRDENTWIAITDKINLNQSNWGKTIIPILDEFKNKELSLLSFELTGFGIGQIDFNATWLNPNKYKD